MDADPVLIPPQDAAARLFPSIALDEAQSADLANGKRIAVDSADTAGPVAALAPGGTLIGLVAIVDGRARVLVNFPSESSPAP
jgi:tRNA pseudouridine55 synthase